MDTKELSFFCSELNLALVITKLFFYLPSKTSKLLLNNERVIFDYHKGASHKEPFFRLIYNPRKDLDAIESFVRIPNTGQIVLNLEAR